MESLQRCETEVPDLGQEYWMQVDRMERCRGLGLPKMLGISATLSALSYSLALVAVYTDSLVFASGISANVPYALAVVLSGIGCITAGCASFCVGVIGSMNAFQQRRWRHELPPRPENYSEETAKKAYHLERNVNSYNTILTQAEETIDDLHVLQSEIEHGLDFTQHYLEAMSEEDVDVLTLCEENPSC